MARSVSRNAVYAYWPFLLLLAFFVVRLIQTSGHTNPVPPLTEQYYAVERVIDGDTLLLTNGTRVRLQGIDTPETVKPDSPVEPWGPEATEFTKRFIEDAEGRIKLTFGKERLDSYGRRLAFVWHGDRMLNEQLVRHGFARARLGYRYSGTMKRRLAAAEAEARAQRLGIWSGSPDRVSPSE